MPLREARPEDTPAIVALERLPASKEFVGQWNEERHRATLASPDARYYVFDAENIENAHVTDAPPLAAYAILRGLRRITPAPIELQTPRRSSTSTERPRLWQTNPRRTAPHRLRRTPSLIAFSSTVRLRRQRTRHPSLQDLRLRRRRPDDTRRSSPPRQLLLAPPHVSSRSRVRATLRMSRFSTFNFSLGATASTPATGIHSH